MGRASVDSMLLEQFKRLRILYVEVVVVASSKLSFLVVVYVKLLIFKLIVFGRGSVVILVCLHSKPLN